MSASNYLENALLDGVLGGPDYTLPATVYVALYTADPGEAGAPTTNEVTGTGYARVSVTNNSTNWPAASSGSKANGAVIDFGAAGAGGWGTVTHFAIVSSASGAGNILFLGALTVSKTINASDPVSFPIGSITITAD